MNLISLRKTRTQPKSGDIFVMLPPDGLFLYGRVIAIDAKIGPMSDCILIYLYRARSERKEAVPALLRAQLLTAPIMTNKIAWSKGYFEPIEWRELSPMDRLQHHCFVDSRGWYFDEYDNRLPGPIEPVGERGLHSFRTIDDQISKALGIALSAD